MRERACVVSSVRPGTAGGGGGVLVAAALADTAPSHAPRRAPSVSSSGRCSARASSPDELTRPAVAGSSQPPATRPSRRRRRPAAADPPPRQVTRLGTGPTHKNVNASEGTCVSVCVRVCESVCVLLISSPNLMQKPYEYVISIGFVSLRESFVFFLFFRDVTLQH